MDFFTVGLIVGAAFIANLTFDVAVNTAQDWYGTVYESAFWTPRDKNSPALQALALEEEEIERLLNESSFRDDGEAR